MKAYFHITEEDGTVAETTKPFMVCNSDEVQTTMQWLHMAQDLDFGQDYIIIYEKNKNKNELSHSAANAEDGRSLE